MRMRDALRPAQTPRADFAQRLAGSGVLHASRSPMSQPSHYVRTALLVGKPARYRPVARALISGNTVLHIWILASKVSL
jgi:hypothetical protein